jgi:DNA-binding response OmpR family regulator
MTASKNMYSGQLVLVVEDELDIAESLIGYLRYAGLMVVHAADGIQAIKLFFQQQPTLVLLDLMLPGLTGLEVLRTVRESSRVPIIVLTARSNEQDVLLGFELGADDYITKPFRPREVMARVQAVLRRWVVPTPLVLTGANGLEVQVETRSVRLAEQNLDLTPAEFDLLITLLKAPNRVFTRFELLDAIGANEQDTLERTVDAHMKNLRKKLGNQHQIETIYGVGYRYAFI